MQTFLKVPPESILLPITTHLPHFLNKRMPKLQARDSGIWWGTLGNLQLMLRKASQALHANDQFTLEEMHHYRMAVTEREVINGCLSVDNVKDHVIIYTRILHNINLQNLKRASAFIDIQDRYLKKSLLFLLGLLLSPKANICLPNTNYSNTKLTSWDLLHRLQ